MPRGATPGRRRTKNPCVKHKDVGQSHSLGRSLSWLRMQKPATILDPIRSDNGAVPGKATKVGGSLAARSFTFPTPRSIRRLRRCPLSSRRGLSEARFDGYYSGSQSLVFNWSELWQRMGRLSSGGRRDLFGHVCVWGKCLCAHCST